MRLNSISRVEKYLGPVSLLTVRFGVHVYHIRQIVRERILYRQGSGKPRQQKKTISFHNFIFAKKRRVLDAYIYMINEIVANSCTSKWKYFCTKQIPKGITKHYQIDGWFSYLILSDFGKVKLIKDKR